MQPLLESLIQRRPFLYHLTAAENVQRIKRERRLVSAAALFRLAGLPAGIRQRRRAHLRMSIDGEEVLVRDQAPLHEGNLQLEGGLAFEDFVATLNGNVFFWPGNATGPIRHGRRHFSRYEGEDVRLLRVPTADVIAANPDRVVHVCKYNSGSPRWNRGRASPRGPATFIPVSRALLGPTSVVEITFVADVILPVSTEVARTLGGPWRTLIARHA